MRVLVTGGRAYSDNEYVYDVLNVIKASCDKDKDVLEICEGHAGKFDPFAFKLYGADRIAHDWAEETQVILHCYPVSKKDWEKLGRAAGPLRNARMLNEFKPDLVVAFKGGTGTANMIKIAREAGVDILDTTEDT